MININDLFVSGFEDDFTIFYKNSYGKNIEIGSCTYNEEGAFPFILSNEMGGFYVGKEGCAHSTIKCKNVGISASEFDRMLNDALETNDYEKLERVRNLWKEAQNSSNSLNQGISGRVYKGISDNYSDTPFDYTLISFWGDLSGKDRYVNKSVMNKLLSYFNIPQDKVLIVQIGSNYTGRLIPLKEWNNIVPGANKKQKEAYMMHLMKAQDKHDATAAFRLARDKKIGQKLTNSKGEEMPLAQYRSMIYQESKKRNNIIKNVIKEYRIKKMNGI